ncbi:MAG TPA: hypothetical protein VFH63_06085 [candidate division Zixibacteria bacterium]|nr:hypothetical protein [candidate division Zixibacteria bacterium]
MNWRAIGCAVVGIAAFVGLGLFGLSLALSPQAGCPDSLQWADRTYLAIGGPMASPVLSEPGDPSEIGSTFFGPTTRTVYGPPGSTPSERAEDRPDEIALDCGNGTFRAYAWSDTVTPLPTASP